MTRTTQKLAAALAIGVLGLGALAACTPVPDDDDDQTPTPPATSSPTDGDDGSPPTDGVAITWDAFDQQDLGQLVDPRINDTIIGWTDQGDEIGVVMWGSSTPECQIPPTEATLTPSGTLEITFTAREDDGTQICTADLGPYGWEFDLGDQVAAGTDVEVIIIGIDGQEPVTVGAEDPEIMT